MQVVWDKVKFEQQLDYLCQYKREHNANEQGQANCTQDFLSSRINITSDGHLIDKHGEHRAYRIDNNALPFDHIADFS